jgi:hypothetical protein
MTHQRVIASNLRRFLVVGFSVLLCCSANAAVIDESSHTLHIDTIYRVTDSLYPNFLSVNNGFAYLGTQVQDKHIRGNVRWVVLATEDGKSWNMLDYPNQWRAHAPTSGSFLHGHDVIDPEVGFDSVRSVVWIDSRGSTVHIDTIGDAYDSITGRPVFELIQHPTDSNCLYMIRLTSGIPEYRHMLLQSEDLGQSWRRVQVPNKALGPGRKYQLRFDYANSGHWFIQVSNDVLAFPSDPYWFETKDNGLTFTDSEEPPLMLGWMNEDSGIEFLEMDSKLDRDNRPYYWGDPVVTNYRTGVIDTLPWVQNIKKCLIDESIRDSVYVSARSQLLSGKQSHSIISYSVVDPDHVMLCILVSHVYSDTIVDAWAAVVTTDRGETWHWIVEPRSDTYVLSLCVDPRRNEFYAAAFKGINGTRHPEYAYVVKGKVEQKRCGDSVRSDIGSSLRVFPNPAFDVVSISLVCNCTMHNAILTDMQGKEVTRRITENDEDELLLDMSVIDVASGPYWLQLIGDQCHHATGISVLR